MTITLKRNGRYLTRPRTLSDVTAMLREKGVAERLARGEGYFYFAEGTSTIWHDTMVMTNRVDALTFDQWWSEYLTLKGED